MGMRVRGLRCTVALGLAALTWTTTAQAQEAAKPAAPAAGAPSSELPEVTVEQKKAQTAPKKTVAKKTAPAPQPAPIEAVQPAAQAAPQFELPAPPSNIAISPLPGSEVPIEKIPRAVTSLSGADIAREHAVIPQDFLNTRVPGVTVDDLQGNSFQTGVQYRGFEASPVNGLPQGLAVYQNGVRINEAFGDTVNWDFLPSNAINDLAVMGSNPIFGLNAIGGSISILMKDGFTYQGADVDTRFGSFGRKQVTTQAGMNKGGVSIYGSFEESTTTGFVTFPMRRSAVAMPISVSRARIQNFTSTSQVPTTMWA